MSKGRPKGKGPAKSAKVAAPGKVAKAPTAAFPSAARMAELVGRSRAKRNGVPVNPFVRPEHPPSVIQAGSQFAQDQAIEQANSWAYGNLAAGAFSEGIGFLGYAYLAELTQRPEYRRISERIATEMTRKWIKLQASGEGDKTEKIQQLEDALTRYKVRECFAEAALQDGFFGRSHLYVDTGDGDNRPEMLTPIGDGRDATSLAKIGKGKIKRFKPVEAVWCYPANYNSDDPTAPDWYKPSQWVVQGKQMHASRLLTFVGREVPDLLKPAYSFGGLSLSQMAKPYVDNWLQTRQSVSDIVSAFSVMVLKTNLAETINTSAEQIFARAELFNNLRDNRGLMMVDKNMEDFANVSAPLGTLDMLQAQSQEHMASVSGIPLVILLGITPTGLNASSEGEIRAFYDWINAYQVSFYSPNLTRVIDFIQLSEFGAVDPDITFAYEPLWSMDEKQIAETKKVEADTDAVLIESGVIQPEEARARIAKDPDMNYTSLSVESPMTPPAPDIEAIEREREAATAKDRLKAA